VATRMVFKLSAKLINPPMWSLRQESIDTCDLRVCAVPRKLSSDPFHLIV
jgi:hypothetical protein